jgi:hypothetical protein
MNTAVPFGALLRASNAVSHERRTASALFHALLFAITARRSARALSRSDSLIAAIGTVLPVAACRSRRPLPSFRAHVDRFIVGPVPAFGVDETAWPGQALCAAGVIFVPEASATNSTRNLTFLSA